MILQLLRQFLNNLDRCNASFCFGISLRFPCPLPKRISSRILSKSMFIPQNHPKSQQRERTCAVKEKPVFRASLALTMLEIELYQISHFQWQSEIWVRDFIPVQTARIGHASRNSKIVYKNKTNARWILLFRDKKWDWRYLNHSDNDKVLSSYKRCSSRFCIEIPSSLTLE